jgi:hypothetical protein
MIALLVALLAIGPARQAPANAQTARDARATITVVDQTGAVLPNATVTVTSLDAPANHLEPVKTNDKGVATLTGLAAGRYTIQAEFPGFETHLLKDVRLKSGDNKHVVVLAIQGVQDSVTVSRDAREIASDRKTTFGTALTREQIEALSDDPDEMAQQLQDMAGGGAVIRVDSFEGGRLPPKTAIKAIHITRDAFAAENHYAGGLFIDIITQPGLGPLRTNFNTRLRSGQLSGRPPADISTAPKGPERIQSYNGGIGGSLIKQKASFNISVNSNMSFDTPYFNYSTPDGGQVTSLAPRRPRDNVFTFGQFDYAITRDQTLRAQYFDERSTSKNLGIGGFDTLQRGYQTEDRNHTLRIQEAGPLGRRFFTNTRASINWSNSDSRSNFDTPTIIVLDNFNAGGRQQSGGTNSKTINLQSDLDYVRGKNSVRAGVQLDGGSYHSDASNNYAGTYTFENMDAYLAGLPQSYSIRIGDPNIQYWNLQAGMYVQDDIRVRKNLTLSPGLRYELQTHLSDYNNVGPRFGITWSPGKSGKTTLRGSVGMFYDWMSSGVYEQTLRVDGVRQREPTVTNPTYPIRDSIGTGISAPTSKYELSNGLQMARNTRVSAGVSRTVIPALQFNALYQHIVGQDLLRGNNLNSPIDSVRPDPNFTNVVQVLGDARSQQDNVQIGASFNFNQLKSGAGNAGGGPIMLGGGGMVMVMNGPPPPPPPGAKPTPANARWNWRRMTVFTNFNLGRSLNNTEGAFSTPATGNISDDWGPAAFDVRRRFNVSWSSQQLRSSSFNLNFNASSAPPYTIRSGIDTNGDLVFNDRPSGIGRNSARGSGQWSINGFFTYFWQFGKPVTMPGGINLRSEGGALAASAGQAQSAGRFRLSLNINAQNLTNHANYTNYVGTIASPLFGHPQSVSSTRKFDVGMGFSF